MRDLALRRAKLDAEEARWLREAERLQIWRPLGMVSALDYLERVLGHTPHVANERLRVARALGELPVLTDAFARGVFPYSAIRELTRVATPATETRWHDAALGNNVRQIEELVAGHRRGEDPEDPADPDSARGATSRSIAERSRSFPPSPVGSRLCAATSREEPARSSKPRSSAHELATHSSGSAGSRRSHGRQSMTRGPTWDRPSRSRS
ncbi:MAG: DUF222 domain-containing protein [Kofleriaceae bacterium]